MKRPLPTAQNLDGLQRAIGRLHERAESYWERAHENGAVSLAQELAPVVAELAQAKRDVGRSMLHAREGGR